MFITFVISLIFIIAWGIFAILAWDDYDPRKRPTHSRQPCLDSEDYLL